MNAASFWLQAYEASSELLADVGQLKTAFEGGNKAWICHCVARLQSRSEKLQQLFGDKMVLIHSPDPQMVAFAARCFVGITKGYETLRVIFSQDPVVAQKFVLGWHVSLTVLVKLCKQEQNKTAQNN